MRCNYRRMRSSGFAVLVVALMLLVFVPSRSEASDASKDAGTARVVDPLDTRHTYAEGDSTSAFGISLPEGASCPGDSANDGWRVQSYLVPAGTDVGSVVFEALRPEGPDPGTYRSLREVNGGIFTQQFTQSNDEPGHPGLILPTPALTFAWYPEGSLPPGQYTIGIACTPADWNVVRFWHVDFIFETASDVQPGGMRWHVVGASGSAASSSSSSGDRSTTVLIVLIVAALAGLAVLAALWLRDRRSTPTPAKEL